MPSRGKSTEKAKRSSKKKTNLLRLYSEMNKYVIDAVDREVVRRLKILADASEEDITKSSLTAVLRDPGGIELSAFSEGLQPYVKHYVFMVKRGKRKA